MALDPTIPLGVKPAAASQLMDPFETMSRFAQIQNMLNQNRLFQQTFAARQRAGQILASSPDLDTAMTRLFKDPLAAPFAGEMLNNVRQAQNTMTEMQGRIQTQSDNGLQAFVKTLGLVFADPTEDTWNNAAQATLSTLSEPARVRVAPAIDSLKKALMDGLPAEPQSRRATFNQRLAGLWLSNGGTPEGLKALAGVPGLLDLGGAKQPTLTLPPQLGGGVVNTGPAYGSVLGPQAVEAPSGPIIVGGQNNLLGPQQVTPSGPGGDNALGGGMPQAQPQLQSPMAPAQSQTGSPQAGLRTPQSIAGDGKPLLDPAEIMVSPALGRGAGGIPLLSKPQIEQANKLQESFSGDELHEYQNAVQSLSSLRYMNNALDEMQRAGGALVPGAFANMRFKAAQAWNTLAAGFGISDKYQFNPQAIASIEDFNKETKRMGLMVINQMLGGQREAAQIITGITQSVPGIENTFLGGKLVSTGLEAAAQRLIDRRQYLNEWSNLNAGNLAGASEAFDRRHPASDYAEGVLRRFGLTEEGFASPQAVAAAQRDHLITPQQAMEAMRKFAKEPSVRAPAAAPANRRSLDDIFK